MLLVHWMRREASRAACTAGKSNPIRTAMMAMTTSNSMSVNPLGRAGRRVRGFMEEPQRFGKQGTPLRRRGPAGWFLTRIDSVAAATDHETTGVVGLGDRIFSRRPRLRLS